MPTVEHTRRELLLKLVYYGPGLGGKTTNLEQLHARTRPELRGKLVSLQTDSERTLFFDLLPVELGRFHDYQLRLHLCTVPGQLAFEQTRRLILRNADGIVFVADSQPATLEANVQSLQDLFANLRELGVDPHRLPLVVQYNKQDLLDALPPDVLSRELRVPAEVPQIGAAAQDGQGVFETLRALVRECMKLTPAPAKLAAGRSPSILPGRRLSMFPDAEAPAVREGSLPPPPRVPSF